jgi:hypothetical protein
MKRLIFLLILFPSILTAQVMPKHSAGIVLMPDYGMGVNYSRYFGHVGVYGSYAHTIVGFSSRRFDTSQKISAGAVFLLFSANTRYPFYIQAGTSYNTYKGLQPYNKRNPHTAQPFDYQVGVGSMANRVSVGFRYDILKNEASVDLAYNFGRQLIKHKHRR